MRIARFASLVLALHATAGVAHGESLRIDPVEVSSVEISGVQIDPVEISGAFEPVPARAPSEPEQPAPSIGLLYTPYPVVVPLGAVNVAPLPGQVSATALPIPPQGTTVTSLPPVARVPAPPPPQPAPGPTYTSGEPIFFTSGQPTTFTTGPTTFTTGPTTFTTGPTTFTSKPPQPVSGR